MRYSYAKAGVNVWKLKGIQAGIAGILESTLNKDVLLGAGHYAALIKFNGKVIAFHTDGVGTKVLVAQLLEKFDTVGIDAVAMNVNDIICVGAKPIAILDYLAIENTDDELIFEIMKGIAHGAMEANCPVVGGETAAVPDLIKGYSGRGFDLSVSCIGEVEEKNIITGEGMKEGDVIIGIESSGLHSNGYSLARKVLLTDKNLLNEPLLTEMLTPTYIYSNAVLDVISQVKSVHGLAHITGGAFSKLQRIGAVAKKGFMLDSMPEPMHIFKLIQTTGGIEDREMYRTFNMGIGFCIVCDKADAEKVIALCAKHRFKAQAVGRIIADEGVFLQKGADKIDLS
jgi:phosphoribosylformylglycinamidine cyclo-ligase